MSLEEFESQLGKDLWTLIEGLNSPLVEATALTSLPSLWHVRASFRLQFADRRILKGRRFQTDDEAERVEYLSRFLDPRYFPKVFARCRRALLIEWVEGEPLTPAQCQAELLRRCGALQGMLHTKPLPDEAYTRYQPAAHDWQSRLERSIHDVVKYEAFTREEGKRLFDLALAYAPGADAMGIGHGDFCAENMVFRAPGSFSVIDNEALSIDACDHDLARTWYRWPMSPDQREAYYDGYNQYRSSADFIRDLLYWVIIVLVDSAAFRLRAGTRDALIPIRQLRTLLGNDMQSGIYLRSELLMKDKDT